MDFYDNVGYYRKPTPPLSSDDNSISAKVITKKFVVAYRMSRTVENFQIFVFSAKINDQISVEITSSKPLASINYLLTSRGKLILSARKDIPNRNTFTITFTALFDMVPNAKLVVYYLQSNGDVVSTNIEVPVTGLNNFVNFSNFPNFMQRQQNVSIFRSTLRRLQRKDNLVKWSM